MTITKSMQVKLPIDPGVVLLDIGFTGDDPNHGKMVRTNLVCKDPAQN